MKTLPILCCLLFFFATGCENDRISRLEKENQEMRARLDKGGVAQEYDLQARCSRDARTWFNTTGSYSRDKDTQLLDFSNHYNKSSNKCFALVEYHFKSGEAFYWINDITLWNIYENSQDGNYLESHYLTGLKEPISSVSKCEVYGEKCKTIDDFNRLLIPYMNN